MLDAFRKVGKSPFMEANNTKKTLVLGASPNPARVSHEATRRLQSLGVEVIPLGNRQGEIAGLSILQGQPELEDVDTITLYLNPQRQEMYYDYILSLAPKRIIFNPGTENATLMRIAREKGIEVEAACTLVMLSIGQY